MEEHYRHVNNPGRACMDGISSALAYGPDLLEAVTGSTGTGILTWLLTGIFALSGGLKLRRPVLAAMAVVDFGIARRVRPALGWALGIGELALAVALLAAPRFGVPSRPPSYGSS